MKGQQQALGVKGNRVLYKWTHPVAPGRDCQAVLSQSYSRWCQPRLQADFPMSAGITPIIPAAACECECTSSLASALPPPCSPFSPPPPVQVAHFPACQCWLHFCDNPHNNEMIGAGSHSAPRSLCWRRTTSVHSVQEGPRTPSPLLSLPYLWEWQTYSAL